MPKIKSKKQNIYISTKYLKLEDFTVQFKIMSYGEILDYAELQDEYLNEFLIRIYESKVLSVRSLKNNDPTYDDKKNIASKIYLESVFLADDMKNLSDSLEISLAPEIATDTFNCEKCQLKGLDKFRNCGLRNEETKDPSFSILLGKKYFKACPVALINKQLVGEAFTAYNIFKAGFLPSKGGWYDQTSFFCLASQYTNNSIETMKVEQMKSKK